MPNSPLIIKDGGIGGIGLGILGRKRSNSPLTIPGTLDEEDLSSPQTRSSTLPIPSDPRTSPYSTPARPKRIRARTSTMSIYTPPLPPVMSRENSSEELHLPSPGYSNRPMDSVDIAAQLSKSLEQPGPSKHLNTASLLLQEPKTGNRRPSKSVSGSRPTLLVTPAKRTQSYYSPQIKPSSSFPASSSSSSSIPSSPNLTPNIVKRKTSIPSLIRRYTTREEDGINDIPINEDFLEPHSSASNTGSIKGKGKEKAVESRARSTSTSIVVPQTQSLTENSTYTFPSHLHSSSVSETTFNHIPELPPSTQAWSGMPLSPPPSDQEIDLYPPQPTASSSSLTFSSTFFQSAVEVGESLLGWVKPKKHRYNGVDYRRGSDDDSEKGLIGSDLDEEESLNGGADLKKPGKYWGMWTGDSNEEYEETIQPNYFELPPTPPLGGEDESRINNRQFEDAINSNYHGTYSNTLPTPALSHKSLSRDNSKRNKLRKAFKQRSRENRLNEDSRGGWLTTVINTLAGYGGGKTAEVLKELGWTVGVLVITFFVTAGVALWLLQSLPLTTLKQLPKSTTDLQLLSAEIRSYMASSDAGWWHTVGVLIFVGCWKHAWSVPGAVILNILVGSLFDPMPALALLTIITATGSLGAYTLSRPLAPLIAVIFPKPLALVRAALAPETIPLPSTSQPIPGETITPIQSSSSPSQEILGGPTDKSTIWRRLLMMRAMGFVPWSGMNVACGVVGVDWKIFWLTTAAGSASWSYVTASVGHILSRLKLPNSVEDIAGGVGGGGGESLTSLLRDPILISKLIFLSGLTLLPVILKKRNSNINTNSVNISEYTSGEISNNTTPRSSSSFELTDLSSSSSLSSSNSNRPIHSQISSLRLDLNGDSSTVNGLQPMSPLSTNLAKFTPTPRMFDLLSFGRVMIRTGQRGLTGSIRGVGKVIRGNGN